MKRTLRIAALAAAALGLAAALLVLRSRHREPAFDMRRHLAEIAAREGVWDNQWDQFEAKIADLSAALKNEHDTFKAFQLRRELARHLIYAGQEEGAVALLEQMQGELGKSLPVEATEAVKSELAFAYFRLAEVRNCGDGHNADSCLFPIAGGGIHKQRLGATEAARLYSELLADPRTDAENALSYRWLLNVSYMTLGAYPQGVPERWRIPPESFRSDADLGRFPDVAESRGLSELGIAGGIVLEDFDNDGHLDAMISHMGIHDQLQLFHNDGDGHFTRRTAEAGLTGITGGLNLVQADFDNDGCIDVLVLRGGWMHANGRYPPSLLRNGCDGTFTDVTASAGLLSAYPTQTAAWADVDGDGYLDLFIGHELDRDHVEWPKDAPNFHLYMNNRDGTFREASAESGIAAAGMIKGVTFGDYDNDGRPDLYVSILGKPNRLYRNVTTRAGAPRFEDVTDKAGVAEPLMSFPTWFFDYDNDGWPDLFVSGYSATLPNVVRDVLGQSAQGDRPRLYHNNHDGTFTDVSHEAHLDHLILAMGSNYGDLDNDGWPDLYLGTGTPPFNMLVPNRMFHNDHGRTFQDVTTSGGFGNLQKGHGVAFGDVDNSGNQDVVEVMGGAYGGDRFWTSLYKNPGHGNHWVKLRLVGTKANRFAVGGRIRLSITENGARREVHWTVGSGGSFGASPLRPHLGVGKATVIDALEVRWPGSGTVQRFAGPIAVDRTWEIREDRAGLVEVTVPLSAAQARKSP